MLSLLIVLSLLSNAALLVHANAVTTNPAAGSGKTFDYIIVGGGLAGLTVRKWTILHGACNLG
jgi:hypothetical protein